MPLRSESPSTSCILHQRSPLIDLVMSGLLDHEWIPFLTSRDARNREIASNALRILLTKHMQATLRRTGLRQGCVEDVVQESCLRILLRLGTFRGESRFVTWAIGVASMTATEFVRKRYWSIQRPGQVFEDYDTELRCPCNGSESDTLCHVDRQEISALLYEAIRNGLTERQRFALLSEMDGLSISNIALRLNTNRGAVYKLMHDARKRLKTELEGRGVDGSTFRIAFEV